ncbi:MAG: C-GCAxxG-C-C family protein [Candidatus Methanomethylicia archaeon]
MNASNYMKNGYACAESVLLAVTEKIGLKNEIIPKIATGFCAGIGRIGDICGAISGGIMCIGIRYGRNKPNENEAYEKCMEKARELILRFHEKYGEIHCEKLIGLRLLDQRDREKYRMENFKEKYCSGIVEDVAKIVMEIISDG